MPQSLQIDTVTTPQVSTMSHWFIGLDEAELTRQEMVSLLCIADRTHSHLMDMMPEKCGLTGQTKHFESTLKEVVMILIIINKTINYNNNNRNKDCYCSNIYNNINYYNSYNSIIIK